MSAITFKEQSIFYARALTVFNVILDVEKYPDFLPWCNEVKLIEQDSSMMIADSVIKFKAMKAEYRSHITFSVPSQDTGRGYIKVESNEGAFKYLNNMWEFIIKGDNKTLVKFGIECQFRSKLMHYTMSMVYNTAQQKIISAFKDRIYYISRKGGE